MNSIEERDRRIIETVKKKYGTVIDLETNPAALIEILQRFASDQDGGTLPGGVPTPPTPPDPCQVFGLGPNIDDLMREILQLRRDVADLGSCFERGTPLR